MSTARTAWDFRQNAGQNGGGTVPQGIFYKNTHHIPVFHRNCAYLYPSAMAATSNTAVASLFASLTAPKPT